MKVPLLAFAALAFATAASAQKTSPIGQNQASGVAVPPSKTALAPAAPGRAILTGSNGSNLVGPNDNCSSATAISGPGPFSFDTVGANTDGPSACGLFTADVWFNWTASASGSFTVSLCGGASFDTEVAVYAGTSCVGTQLACNDDFCGLQSQTSFTAVNGSVYKIRIGGFAGAQGTGTFTIQPPAPPSSDDCTGAQLISGPGPFAFSNIGATTGAQGQANANCNFFGQLGIDSDVWFTWTAGSSGIAHLSLCGGTSMDSKVAVYAGAGCPSAPALACNDDFCGLQSSLCFPVTNAQAYTIQLGNYPGAAAGSGTFVITLAPPPSPCQYDDGTTENLLGWLAGGEMVWLNRFGSTSGSTSVSTIQVAWGSALFPGNGPGNGSPAKVAIWDDPNDDGDPSDAVLLQVVNTTVAAVDTDTFNTIPITPVTVNGVFFLGAGLAHSVGQFVAPMDQTCVTPGVSWFFGNDNTTPADYANLLNNAHPPATFDSAGFPANVLVRGSCSAHPGATFCEPGLNGWIACPCGNAPSGPARGCDNSSGTGGATLTDVGVAHLSADTVVFTTTAERPTALSIVLQGNAAIPPGLAYGDGVRGTGGLLKRLYVKAAVGGSITAPVGADPTVSARSAALGDPIAPGTFRFYQVYYRDPANYGCAFLPGGATFNISVGSKILWTP
jgi:hypothetical protein